MRLKIGNAGTGISKSSGASSESESAVSFELKSTRRPGVKFPSSSHSESFRSSGAESARSSGVKSTKLSGAKSLTSMHVESTRSSGAEFTKSSVAKTSSIGSARLPEADTPMSYASQSLANHNSLINVDRMILNYIEKIYSCQLQKIQRDFDVTKQTYPNGKSTAVLFLQNKTKLPCQNASEKFINLYQNIATNLLMKVVDPNCFGRGKRFKNFEEFLQNRFPKIWVTKNDTELVLVGNPIDVKKAEAALDHNKRQDNFLSSSFDNSAGDSNRRQPLQPECKPPSNSDAMPKDDDKTCPICLEEIEDQEVLKCTHFFCKKCIEMAFKTKSACPVCGEVYGELKGNQPEGGRMTHRNVALHLPGYEKFDVIEISYIIPDGIQGKEHPQPGLKFHGTTRIAFLPNNDEGRKVHKLLQRAFNQRLIFTVGTSSTTGKSNVVTWNDIHHKTNTHGGPSGFGYPDPTYLERVQDELKAKGIY
ncbi:E3 ubiquitin-protein ligase DTX3L [Narcine bancroftii]|uniref:E3 ubiquitin-protein ligase DTX3L n=1 Tax=Narcine bancroftii TaxID=1343680 RepID=UPI003831916E